MSAAAFSRKNSKYCASLQIIRSTTYDSTSALLLTSDMYVAVLPYRMIMITEGSQDPSFAKKIAEHLRFEYDTEVCASHEHCLLC